MERKIIKISNNKIFLTPEMSVALSSTSLRERDIKFKSGEAIYFEVEAPNYDKSTGEIVLRVTNYQPGNTGKFNEQKASGRVSFIHFRPFIWDQIEKFLSVYTHSQLVRLGIVTGSELYRERGNDNKPRLESLRGSGGKYAGATIPGFEQQGGQQFKTLTETGKVNFMDAEFNDGYVLFPYRLKERKEIVSLRIDNAFLLKEFNTVKPYFPKAFGGRKQFNIKITYSITHGAVTGIETTSEEIAAIDNAVIEKIKNQRIANLVSTPLLSSPDKSLFTVDDIFDNFQEDVQKSDLLWHSAEDILNKLVEIKNPRNSMQLQYLSGEKHSPGQKLRFTLKPLFGFLFFIEGETKNHFCWELLNSHATYIWSLEKATAQPQFTRIEQAINSIKIIGRDNYKREFKNNTIDRDLIFYTIEHSNVNSGGTNAFADWKYKIESVLI